MTQYFDTVIWGSSLSGIEKAVELARNGHKVLLASKFGFPGGKVTESLASFFEREYTLGNDFLQKILAEAKKVNHGLLFENSSWLIFHPEAIKRVCWNLISNQSNLTVLFHVVPLKVDFYNGELELFGREGKICIHANHLLDLSDDRSLTTLVSAPEKVSLVINCFFTEPLPPDVRGLQITRQILTKIGLHVTSAVRNVSFGEVERTFNNHLDLLSSQSWKHYQNRILILPVCPEIKFED